MTRNQFTFYRSFFAALKRIRKKSARADAYDAICDYALNGVLPDVDKLEDAAAIIFELIQPVLETGAKKASGNKVNKGKTKKEESEHLTSTYPAHTEHEGEKEVEVEKEKELEIDIENECSARGEGFEKFWEIYPKKVGKQAAKKAFLQAEVSLDTLLAAIRAQKQSAQWQKEGGQFIPNPATWLSQKRWEDRLPPMGGVPKGASGVLGAAEIENIQRMMKES